MEWRTLGPTPLKVSALGLGCNSLGLIPDLDARDIVLRALDLGINFFDTADVYADGRSEETLGRYLAGRREHVVIATKFGHPGSTSGNPGGSRAHIVSAVEGSLKRLQTHWIDLYQMHFPDLHTPIEETLRALDDVIAQGKVRYIGCSNFSAPQIREAMATARASGIAAFATCQSEYSLIARDIEIEVLPVANQWGLGIIPCFPLGGGLLTGKYNESRLPGKAAGSVRAQAVRRFAERFLSSRNLELVAAFQRFATDQGWGLPEMAITWLLAKRAVCSVIAGATNTRQLDQNSRALDRVLEPAELLELERLWRTMA